MSPETWILQRILRYLWLLRHESEDMDLAEEPEILMGAYMPEVHMDAGT